MGPVLLFITSPEINFLEDILHEGLDEVLGPERVWCFPYKDYSSFQYNLYPPSPDQPPHREPVSLTQLLDQRDRVAGVIVGSVRVPAVEAWQAIQDYFAGRPVALVNGEETRPPYWPPVSRTVRFKMDLLPAEMAPDLLPLPLAAPPRAMLPEEVPRDIDVSFVARPTTEARRRYAEVLEREGFLVILGEGVPREQFCWILNRSKISVSLRGAAWDTFRYWEIPYHGALLMSERLPVIIPDDFVDGESAVFFDSPEDMLARIRALLGDPGRLARIAANGRRLCREKHTAAARARYVLERMGLAGTFGLTT
ncbi:MAG: glycosyltransferase [Firmicutes bacterium]|nr:glycosyltransferase [Bacillota bacterium]